MNEDKKQPYDPMRETRKFVVETMGEHFIQARISGDTRWSSADSAYMHRRIREWLNLNGCSYELCRVYEFDRVRNKTRMTYTAKVWGKYLERLSSSSWHATTRIDSFLLAVSVYMRKRNERLRIHSFEIDK